MNFDANEEMEVELLRRLKQSTADEDLVVGMSTQQYAAALRRALVRLGLEDLGITPHSARAGYATDAGVARKPFRDLKLEGRWASDTSLKIYLDALMTRAISAAPSVARWGRLGRELEEEFLVRA